ncbi:tetratricopeptide repeat protein [Aeromonas sp. 600584]|uniref:tetratricopeptide repeat protein n=1 Tax=unclassified Aeromonas TaxID=257493 RepID=UPI003B9EC774
MMSISSGDNCTNIISDGDVNLFIEECGFIEEFRDVIRDEVHKIINSKSSLEHEAFISITSGNVEHAEACIDRIVIESSELHLNNLLRSANMYAFINQDKALNCYSKAYAMHPNSFKISNIYALYLMNIGKMREAKEIYTNSLIYFKTPSELEPIEGNLGLLYKNIGNYSCAIEHLIKASELSLELNNQIGSAKHLNNLGSCYINQGDYVEAIDVLKVALESVTSSHAQKEMLSIDNRQTESNILANISLAYKTEYDKNKNSESILKAIEYAEKGLKIATDAGLNNVMGRHYGNLSNFYDRLGNSKKKKEYLLKAISAFDLKSSNKEKLTCIMNLGLSYFNEGSAEKAISYYLECLSHGINKYKKLHAQVEWNMAIARFEVGEVQKAMESAKTSANIFDELELHNYAKEIKNAFGIV